MPSTFQSHAPKARVFRKHFGGLHCVAAEAVLQYHRKAASTRVGDVQGDTVANETSVNAAHGAISMPAAPHWLRRKAATPGASSAASPWVTTGPSKPAAFRHAK